MSEIKSYVVRFEEMVESRNEAIENAKKVINEQLYLVDVLKNHDENNEEKRFEDLIEKINNQITEMNKYVKNLEEKNIKTNHLIDTLKNNDVFDQICTLVCDELEVFSNKEEVK